MPGEVFGAVIGVTSLALVNIAVIAYSYGRMCQKLDDLCRRVIKLEQTINGRERDG